MDFDRHQRENIERQLRFKDLDNRSLETYLKWQELCISDNLSEMKKLVFSEEFQLWNTHLEILFVLSDSQKQMIKNFYLQHVHYCKTENMEAIKKLYYSQAIKFRAIAGDISGIQNCLENGGDVNYDGICPVPMALKTILHRPAVYTALNIICSTQIIGQKFEVIQFLVERGAIVNAQSVFLSIINGEEIIAKYLLGVYLSYNGEKNYKLMECCCSFDLDISFIKMFIEHGYEYDYDSLKEHFEIRKRYPTRQQLIELEEAYVVQRRKYLLSIIF